MSDVVNYKMPESTGTYMVDMVKAAHTNPKVRELLEAAHHVLAGGTAKVEVTKSGDASKLAELAVIRDAALAQANAVNAAAGAYVSAAG